MIHDNNLANAPAADLPKLAAKVSNTFDALKDPLVQKYANTVAPLKLKKSRSGLTAYTGPWTKQLAIHLSKRTMFGAKPSDITTLLALTPSTAVDALINTPVAPLPLPINYYEAIYPDPTGVAVGATWINADYGDGTVDYYRSYGLKSLWLKNIVNQSVSIGEQMVLFWHNHTPVNRNSSAFWLYRYQLVLRQYALGNFKDYIKAITKEGAMLQYLNGESNNKYSPDENYGRELQELFTVGKDGGQQFTEDDVKAAAKVLTGWRINYNTQTVFFDDTLHDTTTKVFSSFYGGASVIGVSGPTAGDTELDALLNIIFSGNSAQQVALHICRKLYRHFMYYDIDASAETNIIAPLAQTFIANNWEIKPVLEQLFKSDHFFDSLQQACIIKSPIQHVAGILRTLSVPQDPAFSVEDQYMTFFRQCYYLEGIGQDFFDTPNVSGWRPYYQSPQFHELWINSDTFPKRLKYTDQLLTNYGFYVSANGSYHCDLPLFASTLTNPANADVLVQDILDYTFGLPVSQTKHDYFKNILLNGNTNNYWTTAWNDYINNPTDVTKYNLVRNRMKLMMTEMFRMGEFHIA
jgi:Protein of unknown function (DUF1800)